MIYYILTFILGELKLIDNLVVLVAGFLLTTLCGGMLGFAFQRRHIRSQWLRARWEKELEEAQAVFEEVSRLLDRRLYRTRHLLWSFDHKKEVRAERLADYRAAVTDWNDNINRILALLAIHFSDEMRNAIDNEVGAEFVAVGRSLEHAIRGDIEIDLVGLEDRLNRLVGDVYDFNLRLLKEIRTRRRTLVENA